MIYKNMCALREDRELTQKQLAEILGVAQNTYSQYENGVIALTDGILLKLADYYGTSTDFLLDRASKE